MFLLVLALCCRSTCQFRGNSEKSNHMLSATSHIGLEFLTKFLNMSKLQNRLILLYQSLPLHRIEIKDSVKVLGVTLNKKLRFSSFVTSTYAKTYYHLRKITSSRKYLSFDLTKFLILTFVISRLDYCNSLLNGAPDYMIKNLQRVQNRAACLRFHQRNSNVNLLLNELH